MKKSIKSVLAKSLAVAMAFSIAGIAPTSDAAAKKPTLTRKVTVTVGKTKTVKVTSKKKVKKTTWSLKKGGSKLVSLSKKKAKSVVVKGKKKGSTTLTAKIKVGSKTYKKTCKITVKKAATVTAKPTAKVTAAVATPTPANNNGGNNNGGNNATPTPKPTEKPVDTIKTANGTVTVDESATYSIPLTALNETTFTCMDKRPEDTEPVADGTVYNRDGSVTFTSLKDYNSGVSYYINPCTKEDQVVDISDTRGEGFLGYNDGTKDMSAYDYIRIKVTSPNELNCRTYNGNDQLLTAGFPGSCTSETYEGGWIQTVDGSIWAEENPFSQGNAVDEKYTTRTIFIPITMLMEKGMNPETLTAIAFCPQSQGAEVTIHRIDFVKVKYDTKVTGIEVTSNKAEIAPGKTAKVTAAITPAEATRQTVKWSSSDESIATVNFQGMVMASSENTGEVTITATATDGSGVTGSTTIKVAEPQDEPAVITTHKVDLTKVVAKANPGSGDAIAADATEAGIAFKAGTNMTFVDFAQYLADNNLDLADYDALNVTWEVQDADGNPVTTYEGNEEYYYTEHKATEEAPKGAYVKDGDEYREYNEETDSAVEVTYDKNSKVPGYGKIAYVPAGKLNGFDNGIDVNYEGAEDITANTAWLASPFTGQTCTLTIAKTNPTELATVAGFNLQLGAMPSVFHIVIKDITLYKDNNVYVDLTKVVAKTNPGSGDSVPATQSASSIDFSLGGNMLFVNMSAYLEENNIDITEFAGMEVSYQLKNEDATNADAYTDAPGWGNFALVKSSDLNGYTNPGVCKGNLGNKVADTATFDFTADDVVAADLSQAAGFNLQLEKMDADKYLAITGIKLIAK